MKSIVKKIKVWHHDIHDSGRKRLQEAAIGQFEELPSRKSVKKAIQNGLVFVNNHASNTSTWVSIGDKIKLVINNTCSDKLQTTEHRVESSSISVVYEDECIAVVVKPGGVITSGSYKHTLEKSAFYYLSTSTLPCAHNSPKTAHRLDKATHGLVIISKTISASKTLNSAFNSGKVRKEYKALVQGNIVLESGDIKLLIEGKHSRTLIHKLGVIKWPLHQEATYINIDLKTGRTHQIRRHLAMVGHPVVGDEIYHSGARFSGQGLFLACTKLTFPHPKTGEIISFSTKLPRKFKRVTSKLNMS